MHQALRHAFTGVDNQTADLGRILLAFFSVALVALQVVSMFRGGAFSATEFATASGGLLVAGCGALRIKADTEPK